MKINYKLGAFIISILGVSVAVFFGVISLKLGQDWSPHIKALYLLIYISLLINIISIITVKGGTENEL